jgi:hypothetical protein
MGLPALRLRCRAQRIHKQQIAVILGEKMQQRTESLGERQARMKAGRAARLRARGNRCPFQRLPLCPEAQAFRDAWRRCKDTRNSRWEDYGGRGIKFLFTSFEQFFAELGPRPDGMSLDRIENDGNYEPGNVRWATKKEQQRNKRCRQAA